MSVEAPSCGAKGIVWDLSDLYHGDDDPRLGEDLKELHERALSFAASYKGTLQKKNLTAFTLLPAIKDYESINEKGMKAYLFALLSFSSNTQDPRRKRLLQKVREKWNGISQMLTFFHLEILAHPGDFLRGLASYHDLAGYRHFLLHLIDQKPFTLSEPEERIIKRRELSGRHAFTALYDELIGSLLIPVEIEGKLRHFTPVQALAILHAPDRSLREKIFQTFLQELGKHSTVFTSIFNALILNHHQEDVERGHPTPMHRVHLSNEIDGSIVQAMMGVVEDYYPLAKRYFLLKARMLGLKKLKYTDIFAPLDKEKAKVGFSSAKEILRGAMETLHPLFYGIAQEVFENKWIDAEVRNGKQQGALCKCLAPSQHPFISLHFTGNIRDFMTLAHELGHAIHYRLAAQQSYLNFEPSPILAETASTFTELITVHNLMQKEEFRIHRPLLLATQIEGILVSVFRQNVLTRFEQAIHNLRQCQWMSEEEICNIWWEENLKLYGEEVDMTSAYHWGWTCIPHFIHHPFYCYTYIFGCLLSIVLFQNYLDKGKGFLEQIIGVLGSGSSRRPLDMLEEMGLNPRLKTFWEQGLHYLGGIIDSLEYA